MLTVAHSPRLHWASRWACRVVSPPVVCRDQFAANEENKINVQAGVENQMGKGRQTELVDAVSAREETV